MIDGLPWHSPAAALPELGNWLQSVEELPPAPAQALIRAVRRLDEAGRSVLEDCRRELLGKPGEEVQEGPWLVLAAHHERLVASRNQAVAHLRVMPYAGASSCPAASSRWCSRARPAICACWS
ncbi:MAG: hypothetical protein AB1768_14150 [Pseudomonadota bacterium]